MPQLALFSDCPRPAAAAADAPPVDWRARVDILNTPAFDALMATVTECRHREPVYPAAGDVFRALALTPFEAVRVVLLGQDPYHRAGQAHGLAFSVPAGVPAPPSLRNIVRELRADLACGAATAVATDLTAWARQGVLLLNTALTVAEGKPGSHAALGWSAVTDALVRALSAQREGLVYVLWGAHAQAKRALIDPARHHVLTAAHPSPLSARRGFFGCRHFSRVNAHLTAMQQPPIRWLC